jgi:serine/threonine-protein kinase
VTTTRPELYLLGGVKLLGVPPRAADGLLAQSKAVALLAYLALSPPGRHQRRDLLVGLLWPELDQAHARAVLRKAVHAVRTTLGPDVLAARGDEELALTPDALWCDAVEFAASADAGRLARALELYRGELLPGFHLPGCSEFMSWLDAQRAVMGERVAAAAWAMARLMEADSQLTDAGKWARRAVRYSGTDERVLRRAMTMLDRVGDRAGALRLFEDFARRLRAELETAPSAETMALVSTMRSA